MIEIGKDFQGWPLYAMTFREILESLGSKKIEHNTYTIDDSILDSYPRLLEDDGMGYGVNEQYITEASVEVYEAPSINQKVFNIFRDGYRLTD